MHKNAIVFLDIFYKLIIDKKDIFIKYKNAIKENTNEFAIFLLI
jgi:hypothetical protein